MKPFGPIVGAGAPKPAGSDRTVKAPAVGAFEDALANAGVKLSKHARERMITRGIVMNEQDADSVSRAMSELKGKGGKVSLLFVGDTALVANVEKQTVITAVDRYANQEQVFTQIDSAAVVERA